MKSLILPTYIIPQVELFSFVFLEELKTSKRLLSNTVFLIPHNQCYPGTSCTILSLLVFSSNLKYNFGLKTYHFHKILFSIHHKRRVFHQCGAVCEQLSCLSFSKCNFGLACLLSILLHNRLTTFTKSFSAYITYVGSFTSVEPGVYYHFVSLREGLMTKLTRVGSGICEY